MTNDQLIGIITTLQELRRMYQLNFELLEQMDVACGWILDNRIAIPNRDQIASLLSRAKALLQEIQSTEPKMLQYQKLADEKKQYQRTDEDETEPSSIIYGRGS